MRNYRLCVVVLTALLVSLVVCGRAPVAPIATPLATPAVVTPNTVHLMSFVGSL